MTKRERLGLVGLGLVAAGAMAVVLFVPPFIAPAFATDGDGDGLSDSFEAAYGTNPNSSDSDNDGVTDWNEIFVYGTDPTAIDTDMDAVPDGYEINTAHTDPLDDGNDADGNTTATWTWSENLTAPAQTGTSAMDGKGIHMHSGEFTHSLTLLRIDPGYGPSMDLTIAYRSGITYDGPVGNNWNWTAYLVENGSGGDVDYYPGDGTRRRWVIEDPPGIYIPPADSTYWTSLTKNGNGTYTLTSKFGDTQDFDTGGKITAHTDRFGNSVTYSYTNGKLSSITDATGHTVTVYWYTGKNRVSHIIDNSGREVTFTYNHFGQLAKVRTPLSDEYPAGRTYQFLYSNGSQTGTLNDNMIRAVDPRGGVWLKVEFNAYDRVVKQYLGPDYFTFSYDTTGGITTVYDREGNQREWYWSGVLPTALREYSNRDVRSTDPTFWETVFGHTSASLRNKVVYPEGNRVDMTCDSRGNVTEVRRKEADTENSSSSDIVDSYEYDADFNLMTSHTDPRGNETTFILDEDQQSLRYHKVVLGATYPTVTHTDPDQTVEVSFTYNSHGQPVTTTDGEGFERTRIYFEDESETGVKRGYLKKVVVDPGAGNLNLTTQYDYTNWGARTSVTNRRGYTTTYDVNEYDWVVASQGPSPQAARTEYVFNANGSITQRNVANKDKDGNQAEGDQAWFTTFMDYDLMDSLILKQEEVSPGNLRMTYYEYTKNDHLKTLTKPEGNKVRWVYDERDLVYQRTRGYDSDDASTDTSAYDGNRNLVSWENGEGKAWSYEYDNFDRRVKSVNPLGHYAETIFDKAGNMTEEKRWEEAGTTDMLLAHTKHTYDEMNRRWKTERGLKGTSAWSWLATDVNYDRRNLVTTTTDPRGKVTTMYYDAIGRRYLTVNPLSQETHLTFDENGNVVHTETVCASGCSTNESTLKDLTFDEMDRMVQRDEINESDPDDKHTTTFEYDSLNVLIERVDAEGNSTVWEHDGLGRVTSESIDLGSGTAKTRTWGFDGNDRMTSHKDDAQNETTWTYTARDLVASETYADDGLKTYDYDLADNLVQWVDPNGTEVTLAYDDANRNTGRLIGRATGVLGTTEEGYTYDAMDRMTEAKDDAVTVQLAWDSLSRKTSETSGPNPISTYGKTTSYTYDAAGNTTGLGYPDGSFSVTRVYDDGNRLTQVKDGANTSIVQIDFDEMTARLSNLTFGNGTTAHYGYDGFGKVTSIDHKDSSSNLLAGYSMAYDKVGNILYEEWAHDSGKGHTYDYDKAYRLVKTLQDCADPSAEHENPGSQSYEKKIEYNLTDDSDRSSVVTTPWQQSSSTVNYSHNEVHAYTQVGSENRSYDANGNLTDDGTRTYQYDYRNQLVKATEGSSTLAEYEYDPLGRRTKKLLPDNVSVRFYHDDQHEVEEYDGLGNLLRKYVYRDEIDSIAMMEAPDQADVDEDQDTTELIRLYYHLDSRTNVSRITGPGQTVVESYECDPYGSISVRDKNGDPITDSEVGNYVVFQRRRYDPETALACFRARHYDPRVGTFLQRDPAYITTLRNFYEFTNSNPVHYTDPLGLDPDEKEPEKSVVIKLKDARDETDPNAAAKKAVDEALKKGLITDKQAEMIKKWLDEHPGHIAQNLGITWTWVKEKEPSGGGEKAPEVEVAMAITVTPPGAEEHERCHRLISQFVADDINNKEGKDNKEEGSGKEDKTGKPDDKNREQQKKLDGLTQPIPSGGLSQADYDWIAKRCPTYAKTLKPFVKVPPPKPGGK